MTMSEIAKLAKVSVSTVSKAFSGSKEISEKVRERIFEIAKSSGDFNKYVKPLNHKYVIGVICPEFVSGYYAQHLAFFDEEIKKRGGIMLASQFDFSHEKQNELLLYYSKTVKADGIIMYSAAPETIDENTPLNTPVINIGKESKYFDSLRLSDESAMCDAIAYLAENGHTRIAHIGENLTKSSLDNFLQAMKKTGVEICEDLVINVNGARFETAGYDAMIHLLNLENPPTAVIAAYDYIAFGAIKAITERGLKIPEDISIIGRDDVKECDYITIPLTTIAHYSADLCEIVVDKLFEKINSKKNGPKDIYLSSELVKRGTVGKAKNR